ncbi:MAG: DUF559 domain-containing protein [Planctomycetota bacterium]|nr:MAG: DUF559 domain-containing protein [Planctomycetota bacterium]
MAPVRAKAQAPLVCFEGWRGVVEEFLELCLSQLHPVAGFVGEEIVVEGSAVAQESFTRRVEVEEKVLAERVRERARTERLRFPRGGHRDHVAAGCLYADHACEHARVMQEMDGALHFSDASIFAARSARLVHDDFRKLRECRRELREDPVRKHFARGILESNDVVEAAMIKQIV